MEQNLNNKIENALEEIRPFLRGDGGDIELVSVEKNIVKIKLLGNCNGCSVNQMTLKNGVEMVIKKYLPNIEKVVNIDD